MKINLKYALAVVLVIAAAACSPKVKTTTTAPAPVTDPILLARIAEGKTLYETNCNKCHALVNPGKYNEAAWVKNLDWMAPKAEITDEQKATIFAYLSNNAKH